MYHSGIGGGGFMLGEFDYDSTRRSLIGQFKFVHRIARMNSSTFERLLRQLRFRICTKRTKISVSSVALQGIIPQHQPHVDLMLSLTSGVPGEVRGLEYLHKGYGKLPWAQVMRPSINVARNGFTVTQDLVNYEKSAIGKGPNFLAENPSFAIDFAPNGTLLGLNETITRKRYADTLEAIADRGPDAFYTGPIANATILALQAANGTMTLDDLKNYTVAIRNPSTITYRDFKLTSGSAPSSGTVALSVLKTLEGYPDVGQPSAINITTHRLDEAMRFAYGEVSTLSK